jgi:hypothetical protein
LTYEDVTDCPFRNVGKKKAINASSVTSQKREGINYTYGGSMKHETEASVNVEAGEK